VGDSCAPCIDDVECEGSNRLLVNEGFWRDTVY